MFHSFWFVCINGTESKNTVDETVGGQRFAFGLPADLSSLPHV